MNILDRTVNAVDRFQRRWPPLAFPIAVWKKFSDDQAGYLAALIAYYGFVSLFPLLLLLVTVLDITLRNDPTLRDNLLNSALSQYPVIGTQIRNSLGSLPASGLPLVVGIVVLLLGARGVAGAMQQALCGVWGIDRSERPGFPWSQLQGLLLIFTVGTGLVVTTFLSGIAGGIGHMISGTGGYVGTIAVSMLLNLVVFWAAFRIATGFKVSWRNLRIGAAIAAVVWQVLQVFGGYVVSHQLRRASELYGTFGVVLGLLAWLYLQAEVTLYAAEIDTVLAGRLWPRSLKSDTAIPHPREAEDDRAPTDQKAETHHE